MPGLEAEPTAIAEWHGLVRSAERACGAQLGEPLQAYLVFMLMRFLKRVDLGRHALALDYLEGLQEPATRTERLRDTGDECLLVCGLFPQRARRKRVPFRYLIDVGRGAYGALAEHGPAEPYDSLAAEFVSLMEVLQAMRPIDHPQSLSPLEAAEIAAQTGSRRAWQRLYNGAATLAPDGSDGRRH